MYNVDTISLGVNFRRYIENKSQTGEEIEKQIDWDYIKEIETKLFKKLFLDEENKKRKERKNRINRLSRSTKIFLWELVKKKVKEESVFWQGYYGNYVFTYNENWNSLNIMIQNKAIERYTSKEIEWNAKKVLKEYFELGEKDLKKIELRRIDYKRDYKVNDKEEVIIIKNIMKKTTDKIWRSYRKEVLQDDDDGYTIKYIARGEEEANKKHKDKNKKGSRNAEITIYDKEKKMIDKLKKGKATIEDIEKYKDIIRVEVKIKNGILNSSKSVNAVTKELDNYYNEEMAKYYFEQYVQKVLGKEKFYRIDVALKKIEESQTLKDNMKEKLCALLELINKEGYTKAKETWVKETSERTFASHVTRIEELGINIITFDEKIKGKKIKKEYIENFGLIES